MNLNSFFDKYSLQARVWPALLVLFPLLVTLIVWVPRVYELAVGLSGLALASGAILLLANIARSMGRRVEPSLFEEWKGKPTTLWLSHADGNLDDRTKARYHKFLSEHVDDWTAPSPEEELKDPDAAAAAYDSATRWLREKTRNQEKFGLVFKENVSYGFRRNLFGLKKVGLAISVLCGIGNSWALCAGSLDGEKLSHPEGFASLILSLLMILAWTFIIRPRWVRDSADGYARALLATCDQIGSTDT